MSRSKRDGASDDEEKDSKRFKREKRSGNEIRLLIPSKTAGAVIGQGGENIKRLRKDYNADINLPDSSTPERVLCITAEDMSVACEIIADIIPKVDESSQRTRNKDSEVKLLIHQNQAGAVIGRGGSKIKELREVTNTAIKVFPECAPRSTDRVVVVGGDLEKIVAALKEILTLCSDVAIKGVVRNYDATFYEPDMVESYGGFRGDRRGPPPGRMGGRGGSMSGGPGRSGMGGSGLGARGYDSRGPGIGSMMRDRYGSGSGGRGGFDDYSGRMSSRNPYPADDGGPVSSTQVTVPNELAGTIIGKGGDRINRIRDESGAKIVVNDALAGSDERVITIQGTKAKIQMAQYLLQESVKSSSAGRKYITDNFKR